ncbi:hypothetical protein CLCR_10999 [Cladophialophora carrionii]|uniref:Uncharacterized protein n=1 Tax=Cladophialophora carrionii TaxID=86049 RepID=A0A1C1CYM5_9EURO|nr:hypothetical protein CLCR_10999 [Cladophialophora carrionii]
MVSLGNSDEQRRRLPCVDAVDQGRGKLKGDALRAEMRVAVKDALRTVDLSYFVLKQAYEIPEPRRLNIGDFTMEPVSESPVCLSRS